MRFLSHWGIPITFIILYLGVFFGDLGGIGGYDGFAPKWLYEKSIYEGYPYLFEVSEVAGILFLGAGIVIGLLVLLLYLYMLGTIVHRKIKGL